MKSSSRIVIAGGSEDTRGRAADLVRRAGFADVALHAELFAPGAGDGGPDPVPGLFILTGESAPALCTAVRASARLGHVPVAIFPVTDDAGLVDSAVLAGVRASDPDDLIEPDQPVEIVHCRIERLLKLGREQARAHELVRLQEAMLDVHAVTSGKGYSPDALREILEICADVTEFDRASLIAHIEGSESAYVIAATDDPSLFQFVIALDNYPELARVLLHKEPVLLDNAQSDPLMEPVAELMAGTEVRALAAFPVMWKGAPVGALVLRSKKPGVGYLSADQLVFVRMFAAHLGACLEHGRVLESLRERTTHRLSRARYEAERRLRTINSLKEHFEAAADGVLVLDEQGSILFVNRAAENIIGFARNALMGTSVTSLVPASDEEPVRRVIERVVSGQNLDAFDLNLRTTSGETICASVTTSTVLGKSGAAVLSFRDVTAQRALEAELRHTKEFLEKLVDSTVDAIVAADMRGQVIIFNQGAERIFGYGADEVIGRIPVWELYAEGVPRQVMRMLRSTQYGGVGRLEQTRREVLNKQGEVVPVNMTASIIYQDGREVATVGIFSDLRDRIRIEQRLLQAQEKLQVTEKQALVAELAVTAAHELNQPLTSIMGYAQMIERKSELDAPHQRALAVILSEAERMAEIVKKIGRITKYETKEYVGSTRMLDLDRSARAASQGDLVSGRGAPVHPPLEDTDGIDDEFEAEAPTRVQTPEPVRRTDEPLANQNTDDGESELQ